MMDGVDIRWDGKENTLNVAFSGRLDAGMSQEIGRQLLQALEGRGNAICIVDAEKLGYISSAGLRVLLDVKKNCREMKIVNVSLDIYDILSMTGFTKFIPVERRIRSIKLPAPGTQLSKDADGWVYRDSKELVVKIFHPRISLTEVQRKMKLLRTALSYGVPTPIGFEIVSCGESYGLIYEYTHGRTLAELWKENPADLQEEIRKLAELMRTLHDCVIEKGDLPDTGELLLEELQQDHNGLSSAERKYMMKFAASRSAGRGFVYGNLRLSNVLVQEGRLILLDLSRCGRGDYMLDLQMAASAMNADGHGEFWKRFFARYTADLEPEKREYLETVVLPRIKPWWKTQTAH